MGSIDDVMNVMIWIFLEMNFLQLLTAIFLECNVLFEVSTLTQPIKLMFGRKGSEQSIGQDVFRKSRME